MEALERLKRKTGGAVSEDILKDYLEEAEDMVKLYLNVRVLDGSFASKVVQIAAILYERDNAEQSVKSESYSEGVVSESTTYLAADDYDRQLEAVLDTLKRYRRVYVRNTKKDSTEEE